MTPLSSMAATRIDPSLVRILHSFTVYFRKESCIDHVASGHS
jgi:hypothetical protein